MNARTRLPNRRLAESFTFECAGLKYTATVGRFADGSVGEIFIGNNKSNSQADISARDAAIVFSIAVQCGADIEAITQALCRRWSGQPKWAARYRT
jgi:hypothetical protein